MLFFIFNFSLIMVDIKFRKGCLCGDGLHVTLFLASVIAQNSALTNEPKVLIVSYDAFRFDYFERNITPFMNNLRNSWTYSDYMTNVFITSTFPNHQSIATGLFAESHGVVDNEFYDIKTQKKFGYSRELFHYNEDIIPIWTINQKSGKHSGSMMWPGASVEYHGLNLTFNQNFDPTVNWTIRINTVISWFKHETTPMNFGLLYIEEPDHHGHGYGISHPAFNEMLQKLDKITEYLYDQLLKNDLEDVNVIHLSDHGMSTVKFQNIIDVRQYLNSTDYAIAGRALGLNIFPKFDKTDIIFTKLQAASNESKKFDVFLKGNIPKRYHYNNNERIGPIFLSAKAGYAFYPLANNIPAYVTNFNLTITNQTEFGVHGYDNEMEEMRPFFLAYGPAFKRNCQIQPFKNVDVYSLLCEILRLKCPPANGTLNELKKCLTFTVTSGIFPSFVILKFDIILIGVSFGLIITLFVILWCQYQITRVPKNKRRNMVV